MHDPREGVAADGTIRTGVDRSRVPSVFEPVVAALVDAVPSTWHGSPVSLSRDASCVDAAHEQVVRSAAEEHRRRRPAVR